MQSPMNLEHISRPVDAFRQQVARAGNNVVRQSRQLGANALRSSAETLVAAARRLDGLAEQLTDETASVDGQARGSAAGAASAVSSGTILNLDQPAAEQDAREEPSFRAEEVAAKKRAARR